MEKAGAMIPIEGPLERLFVCGFCLHGRMLSEPKPGQSITCHDLKCEKSTTYERSQEIIPEIMIWKMPEELYAPYQWGEKQAARLAVKFDALRVLWDEKKAERLKFMANRRDALRNANRRAVPLLLSLLNPSERLCLIRYGYFIVRSPNGKNYKLNYTRHGNVLEMDVQQKAVDKGYCGHVGEDMTVADLLITQKMILENNPDDYISNANIMPRPDFSSPDVRYLDDILAAIIDHPNPEFMRIFDQYKPDPITIPNYQGRVEFEDRDILSSVLRHEAGLPLGVEGFIVPLTIEKYYKKQPPYLRWGDSKLYRRGQKVEVFDKKIYKIATRMELLYWKGPSPQLNANMLGIPLRIIVTPKDYTNWSPRVMINPEIIEWKGFITTEEQCPSYPGVSLTTQRAAWILVKYQDVDGFEHSVEARDGVAIDIQHQIDAINGIQFYQRSVPLTTWWSDPLQKKGANRLTEKEYYAEMLELESERSRRSEDPEPVLTYEDSVALKELLNEGAARLIAAA